MTRVRKGEPRSRITRSRLIGGDQLTLDLKDPSGVVSKAEIAEFEVLETLDR
ncbi:hypothetical protein ACN27F_09230 [Solwaraspora sp. WMMB335]|uniref:hypothetical protein n=1 Tax=Solwaraspora sp. WMMB335 TaxID=3404118 RepID=UPI003B9295DD